MEKDVEGKDHGLLFVSGENEENHEKLYSR
jgi:hypothetical protein